MAGVTPLFIVWKRRAAALAAGIVLSGCASLNPEAFQGFRNSVADGQKSLEAEMARDVAWTREADVQSVANAKDARLSAYMVRPAQGYAWTMDTLPPHGTARRTLRTLQELNAAFGTYASLLAEIASGQTKDEAYFEGIAAALNQELRDLKETVSGLQTGDRGPLAGLSAFVSEGFRKYLESRRAGDLRAALDQNQPLVQNIADHSLTLVKLIRADLKAAYADQIEVLQEKWDDKRSPGRITLTRTLFNLNEEYADAMESLQALESFYDGLPAAHRELSEGIAQSRKPKAALAALGRSAARVARQTREMEKSR